MKNLFGLAILAVVIAVMIPSAHAQDFDDALESELDAVSSGAPDAGSDELDLSPEEKAPAKPAKNTEPSKPAAKVADAPSLAPASDEPNAAFEARLAGIYSQHSDPVTDEKWSGLIGARAAETYSVQAGDTLWDLSQTLFADGFYWSKLWAENPEIHNPHQISKGHVLRFIAGTEAAPPEVQVVKETIKDEAPAKDAASDALTVQAQANFEKEDTVPAVRDVGPEVLIDIDSKQAKEAARVRPATGLNQAPYFQEDIEGKITQADIDAGVVIEQSEIVPRPALPPPSEDRRKVLLDIPKSFGEYRPQTYDKTVTILRRNSSAEKIPGAVVPGYIAFENMPEPLGTIDEVDQGELTASIGQYVYIHGNEPLTVGAKYYTLSPRYDVKSTSGKVGSAAEIGGVVKIVEVADAKANLYRAVVVYIVNPVRLGSLVLIGEPPRIPVSTKGRRLTTETSVVGGGDSDTRRFFGDGSIVFLETMGSGVRVGDVLAVQARRGGRKTTIAPDQSTPIGILKVFSVQGKVASAIVVLTTEEIRLGDRTGPIFPSRLPDLRIEAPHVTRAAAE